MKFIVIDASVWVRLARANFAFPIVERIDKYGFIPVVNNYLLSEVHDALLNKKWATLKQADLFVSFMETLSLFEVEEAIFRISPDPKDNYLFDLAIQTNALFIISDDLLLLNFPLQPKIVKTCNWFLKHYPV